MSHHINKFLIGDTIRITWISSGAVPSSINAAVYESLSILVESGTMTSSGNGHYYYNYTIPNTLGSYYAETVSWINSYPYIRRERFRTVMEESS